ncbi:methyltransferase domain-containing protein [Chlorobaculum sp. MV4-Y]|uniref:methyltransferase domain-containing protein n=1 Tax=Chlorobaculum sp. MV4-Y TaxID=2976335 RepID=UPI0021AEC799|nr:methyltransferase domain-containing protein [Chlorobaculum sp. MV4-Y]UWX57163.1 methyltransferase domain-containing protein [Chlorobaculum sp. MV4-Y]
MAKHKLDVTIGNVSEVYDGAGGILWEMLMGEQIHVGAESETDVLANKAGVTEQTHLLDVCSALGGPARYLARNYGCRVTGLDATRRMDEEANRRTKAEGLSDKINYVLGNALDMPFPAGTFDVVWGQDAWCYITDKQRLIEECARVLKPGGVLAFTDWLESGPMTEEEVMALNTFMVFPYMETLDGYAALTEQAGLTVVEKEDLTPDFATYVQGYLDMVQNDFRQAIIDNYGKEMYDAVEQGITLWRDASAAGKVGRGRLIARK